MRGMKYALTGILPVLLLVALSFRGPDGQRDLPAPVLQTNYMKGLDTLILATEQLDQAVGSWQVSEEQEGLVAAYERMRHQFKRIEYLFAYLNHDTHNFSVNGPPLPKQDPQTASSMVVLEPQGIQPIEELIYAELGQEERQALKDKTKKLLQVLLETRRIHQYDRPLTDRQVFEACREALIRIFSLGVSGFDTPASGLAMQDAVTTWQSVYEAYQYYHHLLPDEALAKAIQTDFQEGLAYLKANQDFDTFDRLTFLKAYVNPLYDQLLSAHLSLEIETTYEVSSLPNSINYYGRNIFDDELFHPEYYTNPEALDPKRQALGKLLFFDPVLSNNGERACASCHDPKKAFTDGLAKSLATDFKGDVGRNSPTLINSLYASHYFHDMRAISLNKQVEHVVFNDKEFSINYQELLGRLGESEEYVALFEEAYPAYRRPLNAFTLNHAMEAYVGSLHSFDSPFDRYLRGEGEEIDPAVKRGFNLFMGKAVCGTCHFAPVFNGTVPPRFVDTESEVLGVPMTPDTPRAELDPDLGRIANGKPAEAAPFFRHSFKTPTVRNIALTAPYMHNGVYQTLEEVMHFYNIGGGAGLGIELENQTLPFDSLSLTDQESQDIIAFMEALTDTSGMTAVPARLPAFPEDSPLHERVIGGKY